MSLKLSCDNCGAHLDNANQVCLECNHVPSHMEPTVKPCKWWRNSQCGYDSDQEGPPEVIYLLWWDEVGLASPLDATWNKVRLNPCDIKYRIVR